MQKPTERMAREVLTGTAEEIAMAHEKAAASWSRVAHVRAPVDTLDVTNGAGRTWHFVWPAHVALQATSPGIAWSHPESRGELAVGEVLVIGPFAANLRVCSNGSSSFRAIFEDARSSAAPLGERPGRPRSGGTAPLDLDPRALLDRALDALATTGPGFASPTSRARLSGPVARARAYIEENLVASWDLDALGEAAGLDRFQLCRLFHRALGLPPCRFRAHLRVARARELLAQGHGCTHVAHEVGFFDQSHLTRFFKDLTATTPGAYARACRSPLAAWPTPSAA